ncbi:MAG: 30S ribosomal protein S5 [Candidatus Zambryskibacteria bacterium CG10_big_fil_rev_8_21_14_0_10_42_12]|uniref:Small ribosomal subunit protein uS5 n=1 Tax=Candidatus Zambryskibacteria bacterium CG10_big_fil_rev_8_21_14_0_10_42_12 TaxID=1975115 RepID=A0A2H0QWE0_9BACT|nr:MAG: 30S ribosomal protein S5 [Candidatus Zambryskibacteria bacterium CG10_big_fil_rev_8_21_14_0_10_42_12]
MAEETKTTEKKEIAPLPKTGGRTVRMVRGGRRGSARPATKEGGDKAGAPKDARGGRDRRGGRGGDRRERSEFDNRLLEVRRVTRVVSGGRRFSFAASVVIGDKKGRVGVGTGKSSDTPLAIDKAVRDAKKNLVRIPTTKNGSIAHEVQAKYASATVSVMPTRSKSITAGSALRYVLELAGIQAVTGKILSRSKNKTNIARATIKALKDVRVSK